MNTTSDKWSASFSIGRIDGARQSDTWTDALNWLAQQGTLPLFATAELLKGASAGLATTVQVPGGTMTLSPPGAKVQSIDAFGILDRELDGWEPEADEYKRLHLAISALRQLTNNVRQIIVLAEFGTTGPGKCASPALTAEQATGLRRSISDLGREALARIGETP